MPEIASQGVKEIALLNGYFGDCSGPNVYVRIFDPTNHKYCDVERKPYVYANTLAYWRGAELGNCAGMNVNIHSLVYFMTTGTDGFCPELARIRLNDQENTLYEAKGQLSWYNTYTSTENSVQHGLSKLWPLPGGRSPRPQSEPLICPAVYEDDTCQAKDMHAYQIAGREKMNCIFECSKLKSVTRSTRYLDTRGTGFRCLKVNYNSVQFDWCCKTKSTTGGIPHCQDVPAYQQSSIAPIETTEVDDEEVVSDNEPQCPMSGCPIDYIKTIFDSSAGKVNENCEVLYQCDYIKSLDGNDPQSGVECRPTSRPRRKLVLCCDDPNADSDLPQCGVRQQAPSPQPSPPPRQLQGSLADGCPREDPNVQEQNPTSISQIAGVRCCSDIINGRDKCKTPRPCLSGTYDQAQRKCEEIGRRLCTSDELRSNICCRSGCGFDGQLIWQKRSSNLHTDQDSTPAELPEDATTREPFQCTWGPIPADLRCDGNNNCGDNSDEINCPDLK